MMNIKTHFHFNNFILGSQRSGGGSNNVEHMGWKKKIGFSVAVVTEKNRDYSYTECQRDNNLISY